MGDVLEPRARRLIALAMIVVLASGCATYRGSKRTAIAGGVIAAVGIGLIAISFAPAEGPDVGAGRAGLVLSGGLYVITGAVFIATGLIGMHTHRHRDRPSSPPPAPPPLAPAPSSSTPPVPQP